MLPIGKLGKGFGNEWDTRFNTEELKTMMTLWCMFRSPLMIGTELTLLDECTLSLLTNKELLALMNENCKGTQLLRTDEYVIWKNKDGESGRLCAAIFNISDRDAALSVSLEDLEEGFKAGEDKDLYEIWDKHRSVTASGRIETVVPAHGVKVYQVG